MTEEMTEELDLFVIGAGSGGVRAARMSAGYGARVAIAEDLFLGGTCVNVGCVPKKLLVHAAEFSHAFNEARGFGWQSEIPAFDWQRLLANKDVEISRLNEVYRNLLKNAGVQLVEGRATLKDSNTVEVAGKLYRAKNILVATGGWPFMPDIPGIEHAMSSNDVFYLQKFPEKIVIVGGGYIAVEFAGIFNGLGAETHLIYRGDKLLRGFDEDLRACLAEEMQAQGVRVSFQNNVSEIIKKDDGTLGVCLTDGESLECDNVLFATGRKAKTDGLGLENTEVKRAENGAILVDDRFRTTDPSIFAIGDVIDRVQLTPVAIKEAMALSANLFLNGDSGVDYENIATAVFSYPQIGTVGLTEQQARQKFSKIRVYRTRFRSLKQTLGGGKDRVLMKLIVDDATDKVLGCHMLGDHAGEIIQGLAVAIKAGATKAHFDATVGIHPTMAEEFVTMRDPVGAS